jgi:O-antigen/teichoic acid export membrane protein
MAVRVRAAVQSVGRSGTVRFAPGKVVPALLIVIATPVFARVLGPTEYGVLAVATTCALLGAAILFGWTELVAVREMVDPSASVESLCSEASMLFIGGLVAAAAAITLAVVFDLKPLLVACVSLAILCWSAVTFAVGMFRGRGDPRGYVRTAVVGSGGRTVLGIPAALAGAGPAGILAGWAAGGLLAVGLAAKRLRISVREIHVRRPSTAFVQYALPAVAVASGFLILSLADRGLLELFDGSRAVGTYSLGYSLVEQSLVLGFSVLQASGFPRLLGIFADQGPTAGAASLGRAITRVVALTGVVAIPLAIFGSHILVAVGGASYGRSGGPFLQFVVVGVVFLGVGQYLSIPLQHERQSRIWGATVLSCAAANIAANLVLIPPLGLEGAGIATAIAYGLFLILSAWVLRRRRYVVLPTVRLWPCAGAAVTASLIGALALATHVWVLGLGVVPASYVAVLAVLNGRFRSPA